MATTSSPYSFENFIKFVNVNFGVLLLVGVSFVAGFFIGSLWTRNGLLESGTTGTKQAADAGTPSAAAPVGTADQVPEITDDDHIRGSRDAEIFLVEYSDMECPFCARFHPTMQQAMEKYGDRVAWVYRHFPLTSLHPNAQPAAEASECIADIVGEDAFWQFADAMAEETNTAGRLSPEAIEEAAQATGVNMSQFQDCLDSGKFADLVKEHQSGGAAAGVTGTPGTIVVTSDGGQEKISGALPFEQVQQVIEAYLN